MKARTKEESESLIEARADGSTATREEIDALKSVTPLEFFALNGFKDEISDGAELAYMAGGPDGVNRFFNALLAIVKIAQFDVSKLVAGKPEEVAA